MHGVVKVLASLQFEINYIIFFREIGIVFRLYHHLTSALIAEDDHRIWNYTIYLYYNLSMPDPLKKKRKRWVLPDYHY